MSKVSTRTTSARRTLLACGAAVVALATAQAAEAQVRSFNIPSAEAVVAIPEFARQADVQIVAPSSHLHGVRTPLLRGALDTRAALKLLLQGTGLEIASDNGHVITLREQQARLQAASAVMANAQEGQPPPAAPGTTTAPSGSSSDNTVSEVVVTGTLIRGIAPVGTNVVTVGSEQIQATGALSTQQLLTAVPQISNTFNATPTANTGVSGGTIVRPNIRNLAANGGNTTLVLLDGHNMVGAGILQTTPDIGVIPPGALQRVDVVPDGGSSLYGSDAVGGIVNLITRKDLEGVEFDGHYGWANHYEAYNVDLTGGHKWDTGSVLLAYSHRQNTDLLGAHRDYFRTDLTPFGGSDFRLTACTPGNVTANGVNYALPGRTPGTTNLCDPALAQDVFPRELQDSVYAHIQQSVTNDIDFRLSGYFTHRNTVQNQAPLNASGRAVDSTNPYFQSIAGETSQLVSYDYSGFMGPSVSAQTEIKEYGVTPELEFRPSENWTVTALGNYGRSVTTAHTPEVNPTAEAAALAGTTTATALNPYDIAATNPAVLSAITHYEQFAQTIQTLGEARVIANGTLYHLPGGDIRLATGVQVQRQTATAVQTDAPIGDLTGAAHTDASRTVEAVFGELLVPIVGSENAMTGVRELSLDASLRYDHYSDVGGTTNPKIGITWKPLDDLTIRGNWGTSFNAPSLADTVGAVDTRAAVVPVSPWQPAPFSLANFVRPTILLAGGNPNLRPQTADTYSVGADYRPHWAPGLSLSLTYWNVALKDVIQVTPFTSPSLYSNPALANLYVLNPTLAQAQALIGNERIQGPSLETLYATGSGPFVIINAERNNLGTLDVDGLDFNVAYTRDTPIGTVTASWGGTFTMNRTSTIAGSAPFDELANSGVSPLQFSASLGTHYHQLTARVLVNYTAGYPVVGVPNQTRVSSFAPVNLYFAYDFDNGRYLKDTTLTLNIDNVGNVSPPFYNNSSTWGVAPNQGTWGRFVNVGIHKHF